MAEENILFYPEDKAAGPSSNITSYPRLLLLLNYYYY
jgi:hypothetical protein